MWCNPLVAQSFQTAVTRVFNPHMVEAPQHVLNLRTVGRLKIGDTAGWKTFANSRLVGLLFALLGAGPVSGGTLYLTPSADTTLVEHYPSNNLGAQLFLNSGTTQIFTKNRALLKFDIAAQLPAAAKITSASLTLEVTGQPVDGDTPTTFELRRVLRDWGEGNKSGASPSLGGPATLGEANWTHRFAFTTNDWGEPGGLIGTDFSEVLSSERYIYGVDLSPYSFNSTPEMAADVQFWLAQATNNFGWMLISRSEELNFSARRFASREDPFRAPLLAVDYFVPRIDSITMGDNVVTLRFTAEAGQAYAVEACDALNGTSWNTLISIAPQEAATEIVVQTSAGPPHRFYRLAVP